jgi:hypothetical protein
VKIVTRGVTQRKLPRNAKGRLRPGLDGVLSAPVARPTKRAARGPCRRAVGTDIWAAQREARRGTDGSIDKMPYCMSGDATALGCGRKGGGTVVRRNQHMDVLTTGNSPVTTGGRGAGEIWGKMAPKGGSQLEVIAAQEMVTGRLMSGIGPGDTTALGRHGENGPRPLFQFNFPFSILIFQAGDK